MMPEVKAQGISGVALVTGSFIGLILGGVLAPIEWRLVFLVSVPFGIFGTVWAYLKLKDNGVMAAFDGMRILLQKPEEGVYAEGMAIVVGEQGEIDVSGRSLGHVGATGKDAGKDKDAKKKELIAEIISHFSL